MKADTKKIRAVVYGVVDDLNEQSPNRPPIPKSDDAVLFGQNGSLDSLGLVHFVVGVEQGIAEGFGVDITLASDRAMSRRNSPFRTIHSLVEFIGELLHEQEKNP
jgi:D-alanine--poly(phosphoribitol) ligase subunit 2